MKLCLSRIQLSPYSQHSILLASDPNKLHRAIYSLFASGVDSGRVLFRVDTDLNGPSVLIQSSVPPEWSQLALQSRDLREAPVCKEIEVDFAEGSELSFRVLARPVRRTSTGKGNPPGPRKDLRTDEERLEWLHRKSSESGFRVTTCGLTIFTMASIHSGLGLREKGGSFSAVRFDGTLVVTDSGRFAETIRRGIGTQKGFGFGLLSLSKV